MTTHRIAIQTGRSTRRRLALVPLAIAVALATACGTAAAPPVPDVAPIIAAGPRGELLAPTADVAVPALADLTAQLQSVRYRSTAGDGITPTSVSAVVAVPVGPPPPTGWPIAVVAPGTVGNNDDCAPSRSPDLRGAATEAAAFLSAGFVTVVIDYQGLGSPGPHPYLDPTAAANNVIDAVRAARNAVPQASSTWVAYGFSQGAQAVWAANESAADYGSGLHLAGVAAVSPPTDLAPIADAVVNGTLNVDQIKLLPLVLDGLQAAHPDFPADKFQRGALAEHRDVLRTCVGDNDEGKGQAAEAVTASDYKPATAADADKLRALLSANSLPRRASSAPMLVVYGTDDPILKKPWTDAAVQRACGLGDALDVQVHPGQGHDVTATGNPAEWLKSQIGDHPFDNFCTR